MNIGIVTFPGSNCDHDVYHVLNHVCGAEARYVWHKDRLPAGLDAVVVPGGFSYGDYLRCGALARFSPVMEDVVAFANGGLAGRPLTMPIAHAEWNYFAAGEILDRLEGEGRVAFRYVGGAPNGAARD